MAISLLDLKAGKSARIKRLDSGLESQAKLASMNIRIGKTVRMVAIQPFRGPVVIEVDGRKITLGRGLACRIFTDEEK